MAFFSRQVAEQIERHSLVDGSNVQQLEGLARGMILALKEIVGMMGTASARLVHQPGQPAYPQRYGSHVAQ